MLGGFFMHVFRCFIVHNVGNENLQPRHAISQQPNSHYIVKSQQRAIGNL